MTTGTGTEPHDEVGNGTDQSRRSFLTKVAAVGTLGALAGWMPAFRVNAADSAFDTFPSNIGLFRQAFRNWAGDIHVEKVLTCSPRTEAEVVDVVNWAWRNGHKVRPRGQMHNWSPLTLSASQQDAKIILVDTCTHLKQVDIDTAKVPARVTAQSGVLMQDLMTALEHRNLGFIATPAPGDLTLGGVLAINGHGTGIAAQGEKRGPGQTYGSMSNNVLSLTAVVWDAALGRYGLKTFHRDDPECAAFLTHLGRAFITRATLQVGANYRLRCESFVSIPSKELFAPQGSGGRTFDSFLKRSGRVEAICFPFTKSPWLKVWTVAPSRPPFSRHTTQPFNYPFSDNIPPQVSDVLNRIAQGSPGLTPALGNTQLAVVAAGLLGTGSRDLWGWSKNTMLYIKPTTLRVTANGYAVLTRRADVQRVVHEFVSHCEKLMSVYREYGLFPINGPVEIRVTGLDDPSEVATQGAVQPLLSAVRPNPQHPEWDTAVWLDLLTTPGNPRASEFYRDFEQWLFSHYTGDYAQPRVEWSKGWGYSETAAWDDADMLGRVVPDSLRKGQPSNANWDTAMAIFKKYDPKRLYTSPMLDRLMP